MVNTSNRTVSHQSTNSLISEAIVQEKLAIAYRLISQFEQVG